MTLSNDWNRTIYRLYAPVYDWVAAPLESGRRRAIETLDLNADDRILILGCGTGSDLAHLPAGATVVAIDITPAMVRRTANRAETVDARVDTLLADAETLPFDNDTFDAVLLHLVLSVVPDPDAVVAETDRVLDSDGRISIYDKFIHAGMEPSLPRRAVNPLARRLFSDLTRELEPMLADTDLAIESRESALGGLYTVATAGRPTPAGRRAEAQPSRT